MASHTSSPSGSLDGSSSETDSDFEEVEASAEDVAHQGQLEASLAENPRQYDMHLQVCCLRVFSCPSFITTGCYIGSGSRFCGMPS